jgi:hypothetical protein
MNDEQNEKPKTEEQAEVPAATTDNPGQLLPGSGPTPTHEAFFNQELSGVEFVPAPPIAPAKKAKKPKRETKGDRLQNAAQAVLDAVEEARNAVERRDDQMEKFREELESANSELADAISEVEARMDELRGIRDDEYQGWYDNMPEGLKQSAVGEKLETLLGIDLEPSMPEVGELPELDEVDFDDIESAAQEVMDADLPLGFGRD